MYVRVPVDHEADRSRQGQQPHADDDDGDAPPRHQNIVLEWINDGDIAITCNCSEVN